MNDASIREIQSGDHAQWQRLWASYNAFYGRSGPTALSAEVVGTTWRRFLDPEEPMHAAVAEQHGRLIGLAHYLFHRSTIQIQLTCYMQDLFTAQQARGTGIGRKLILAVCERAKAAGSPRVYWQTHETNADAMRLYDKVAERSGFVVYRKMLGSSGT